MYRNILSKIILAHGWISRQPALLVLSNNINPYFQYGRGHEESPQYSHTPNTS